MVHKVEYTWNEIVDTLTTLLNLFDLARIVDPVSSTEYSLVGGKLELSEFRCFSAWAANRACKNCCSSRALRDHARATKFEFIDRNIFYVVSQYIVIEGKELVLEVVSDVTDHLLIEGLGKEDFVSRIISYNKELHTDPVSGISNRRYFDEQTFLLAKRTVSNDLLALAIIDIDDFKEVNDRFGHAAGDSVIRLVA